MRGVKPLPYIQGGPPPCHVIALDLWCLLMALALRSTWHPLTKHPNEPRAPVRVIRAYRRKGLGETAQRGTYSGVKGSAWGPPAGSCSGREDSPLGAPGRTLQSITAGRGASRFTSSRPSRTGREARPIALSSSLQCARAYFHPRREALGDGHRDSQRGEAMGQAEDPEILGSSVEPTGAESRQKREDH
jgi:hypothetical protein